MGDRPRSRDEAKEHITSIRHRRGMSEDGNGELARMNKEDLEAAIVLLAEGLYDKSSHFLFELIQNADDCTYNLPSSKAPEMRIAYLGDRLLVAYNEVGFLRTDVESICRIGRSTKTQSEKQIGEKGIGFKSVFKIADIVFISSGYYTFKFDRSEGNLGMVTPEWVDVFPADVLSGYTSILLYIRKDVDQSMLRQEMQEMDPRYLLFLKNLRAIQIGMTNSEGADLDITLTRTENTKSIQSQWVSTLTYSYRREDEENLQKQRYFVSRHIAKDLPKEPKRGSRTTSYIFLAFPIPEAIDGKPKTQQVYAFLPIRDFGFTFLCHADFLLTANRSDIETSPWNDALRNAMVGAFVEVVPQFREIPELRYTWPRYIPSENLTLDFFLRFRWALNIELRKKAVVESQDGSLRIPSNVLNVPDSFNDDKGAPLALTSTTIKKYLSHNYLGFDRDHLTTIGVSSLSAREFIRDLEKCLQENQQALESYEPDYRKWICSIARALLPWVSVYESAISDLAIVRLSDGRWAAASSANIFFRENETQLHVPKGINVYEVHESARNEQDLEKLYTALQIKPYSVVKMQNLVLTKHRNHYKATLEELVSQAHFLFNSNWSRDGHTKVPFWVVTGTGNIVRSWETYVYADEPHSAYQYLKSRLNKYPFMDEKYHRNFDSSSRKAWTKWACQNLDASQIPRIVEKGSGGSSGSGLKLSNEFQYIIQNNPSHQFLTLLQRGWFIYSQYFVASNSNFTFNSDSTRKYLTAALADTPVTCLDGKICALSLTSTGYFLPRNFSAELALLWPILNIPDPQSSDWAFLKTFGVVVKDDGRTYLRIMSKIRGYEVSIEFLIWLYEKIQGAFSDDYSLVRKLFKEENCIYIQSAGVWVSPKDCVWDGPSCLTIFHQLSTIYADQSTLFRKQLNIGNATIVHLTAEVREISLSTPVTRILDLFQELSKLLSKPLSDDEAKEVRDLSCLEIFPLDGGGGESAKGFDELTVGTPESEWYIADRIHLHKCFHGVISLLAFPTEVVVNVMPLITRLGLESRLLSRTAKGTRKFVNEKRKLDIELEFRSKVSFFKRLMVVSSPKRIETIHLLENMEVWAVDKILLGWGIDRIDTETGNILQEGHVDDEDLGAIVTHLKKEGLLRIHIREDRLSRNLPYEFAEQLADFCDIQSEMGLIIFIMNEEKTEKIEATLDRKGFPKTWKNINDPANHDEASDSNNTAAEVPPEAPPEDPERNGKFQNSNASSRSKDEEVWIGGPNVPQSVKNEKMDPKATTSGNGMANSTTAKAVQPNGIREKNSQIPVAPTTKDSSARQARSSESRNEPLSSTVHSQQKPLLEVPKERLSQRPNYVNLSETPELREYVHKKIHRVKSRRKIYNTHHSTDSKIFERPTIIDPNIVFVQNPQEFPSQLPSQTGVGQILQGRARISESGDCTIYLAREATASMNGDTEFLGELFVSKLLEKYLGHGNYSPHKHWTSSHRERAGHRRFDQSQAYTSTFTLSESSGMTEFLIQSGSGWKRHGSYPTYHLIVRTTDGGLEAPFRLSNEDMEFIRKYQIPVDSHPTDVVILVRIYDMDQSIPSTVFFFDAWSLYESGVMKIQPNNDSYTAVVRGSPHLRFRGFEGEIMEPQSLRAKLRFVASFIRDSGQLLAHQKLQDTERKYTYHPLCGDEIRLLELYPGRRRDKIKGELKTISLGSNQKQKSPVQFEALSYVWGKSLKPFIISLGKSGILRITTSLHFALTNMRDEKKVIRVWADAICINQEDEDEKARQVDMMNKIYKSPQRVSAWLGEEADQSSIAINFLLAIKKKRSSASLSQDSLAWIAINKFFSREWFRRVWIVQELVLPPEVVLFCGCESLRWDDIYTAAQLIDSEANQSSAALMKSVAKSVAPVLSLGKLREAHHRGQDSGRRELLSLFKDFQHTLSTDLRDKLFAFQGLACDAEDQRFNSDYKASLAKVVTNYARVFIERGKGMYLLYHAGISNHQVPSRFPSWVPNWTTTKHPETITTWPGSPRNYAASIQTKTDIRMSSKGDKILSVTGYIFDEIVRLGKPSFDSSEPLPYLNSLFTFIRSIKTYPNEKHIEDLVWKIPIGDARCPPSGSWEKVDFRFSYRALIDYLKEGERSHSWNAEFNRIRTMAKMRQFLYRPEELRQQLWQYLFTAIEFSQRFVDARICVTKKGYVGIVPGASRVGAIITVIHGSAIPLILEASEDSKGCYQLIGEGYIHGIMHGNRDHFENSSPKDILLC